MKQILVLFYNDYDNPTQILSYSLLNEDGSTSTHNVVDRTNTPYWRLPSGNIDSVLGDDLFIYDKKTLYKYSEEKYNNLTDVNSSLFHHGMDPVSVKCDATTHINYVNTQLMNKVDFNMLEKISSRYNDLIRAESILDGNIMIEDQVIKKTYDHYSKGLRLRDTSGKTLSLKKSFREKIRTKGIRLEFDMESFHLRIIDTLIKGGIPNDIRAHDFIIREASLNTDDDKKRIFSAMYSENFDSIDCEFFRLLKVKHERIKSPFGRDHNNFNYKIQEYESFLMSNYIKKLNVDYVDILLYLYDGLYIDLIDPSRLREYITHIKENINLPFTIKIGNIEKRFYNNN